MTVKVNINDTAQFENETQRSRSTTEDSAITNFIGANTIVIVVVAIGLAFGLAAFLQFTRLGRAMRAVSDDPVSASLWAVPVGKVGAVSWMLGSFIAAVAGILIPPFINFDTTSLTLIIIDALAAALIGGLVSLPLTVLGGFLLGLLETAMSG